MSRLVPTALLRVAVLLSIAGAAAIGCAVAVVWRYSRDLPDYRTLVNYEPAIASRIPAETVSIYELRLRFMRFFSGENGESPTRSFAGMLPRSVIARSLKVPLVGQGCEILSRLPGLRDHAHRHHLPIVAAGLSFYGLMAVFPALVVFLSLYGLMGDPREVERHLAFAQGFLPGEVIRLLAREMHKLVAHPLHRLTLSLAFGLALMLASATTAAAALMGALNIVFGLEETRSFLKRQAIALCLTAGLTAFVVTLLGFLALTPAVLRHAGLAGPSASVLALARWPIAALLVSVALAAIYRHGPNHGRAVGWMLGWGTQAATAAWLTATAGFSFYVERFHAFDRTYGSVGAVAVLLMWLYLTALIVLVGAAIHMVGRRAASPA